MEDNVIEEIISKSIEIGVFNTLNRLGLTDETVTESQAIKQYGRRLITEWRSKR